jgi:hypothetical protein
MSHQRRTGTINLDEEEDLPIFDLPDAPIRNTGTFSELNDSVESPRVEAESVGAVDIGSQVDYEDMSSFKRVIVVEVEMNIIQSKTIVSRKKRVCCSQCSESFTRIADLERHYQNIHLRIRHHCFWPGCGNNRGKGYIRMEKLRRHQQEMHGFA